MTDSTVVSTEVNKYERTLLDRLNAELDKDLAKIEAKLVNRGLSPGSSAYDECIREFDVYRQNARTQAILHAGEMEVQDLKRSAIRAGIELAISYSGSEDREKYEVGFRIKSSAEIIQEVDRAD